MDNITVVKEEVELFPIIGGKPQTLFLVFTYQQQTSESKVGVFKNPDFGYDLIGLSRFSTDEKLYDDGYEPFGFPTVKAIFDYCGQAIPEELKDL